MGAIRSVVKSVVSDVGGNVSGIGGFSFRSYWSSLISATVEDAAPTDVILTFPSAKSLVYTDITATVNGVARVVSSASWTGSVWTVVLASAVALNDVVIVTFVKTGQTKTVTNNVDINKFIITVDTSKAGSAVDIFILPLLNTETYDYYVEWEEGGAEEHFTVNTDQSHTYSSSGIYQIKIRGTFPRCYFNDIQDKLKILSIDNWGKYGEGKTDQTYAFNGCANLISIANDWTLDSVLTNGYSMFRKSSLSSLPPTMTLALLEDGYSMFDRNNLTSLPDGMLLPALIAGRYMFPGNNLTSLPDGMLLPALIAGRYMFDGNSLTSLPDGMLLTALIDGDNMFRSNTINTSDYSNLLIRMEANNINTGVPFSGGNSKYNSDGETARNLLTARDPAWTITDGGLEV